MQMARPASIRWFERLVLLSIALGVVNTYLIWDEIMAQAAMTEYGASFVFTIQAITYGFVLLLLWFITWRRSRVGKWIYVVLSAVGLLDGVLQLGTILAREGIVVAIEAAQYLIMVTGVWMLFRADTRPWFDKNYVGVDPEIFR